MDRRCGVVALSSRTKPKLQSSKVRVWGKISSQAHIKRMQRSNLLLCGGASPAVLLLHVPVVLQEFSADLDGAARQAEGFGIGEIAVPLPAHEFFDLIQPRQVCPVKADRDF